MTDARYIRREDTLNAIDPGHGDFHAGDYNAIAALPYLDLAAMIEAARREALEEAYKRVSFCRTPGLAMQAIRALAASPPTPTPVDGENSGETVDKGCAA